MSKLIGCVGHDCDDCKKQQGVIESLRQRVAAQDELMREMGEALEMYMADEDIPWSVVEAALTKYKEVTK